MFSKKELFLFILLLVMLFSINGLEGGSVMAKMYTNPVGGITEIGDPYVLKVQDKYYLYTTSLKFGFKVWISNNLVDWKYEGVALDAEFEENSWGNSDFWAPEVIEYQNKFYMIYSARDEDGHLKIAIAVSISPLGPFINIKAPLFDRGSSFIDGHIFIDEGIPYLYYVKDCSENIINGKHISQIYVQKMEKNLLELKGDPILAIQPDQVWEGIDKDWQWNEGPFVLKYKDTFYMMYSANVYSSSDYSIGYATASNPLGPWEKFGENPIMKKNLKNGISGPGHNSVTVSPDGNELFIVYHTHTYPDWPDGNRTVNIDRLYFKNERLKVHGPTNTPQPMPSGIEY